MMKREYELSSIQQRINSIRMTDAERGAALAALRNAFIVVDACAWVARKIGR